MLDDRDIVLFTLVSTYTGKCYTAHLWAGYGVVCPDLWTTNGSCAYMAKLAYGHVQAGNYTVEPGSIAPDFTSEEALTTQLREIVNAETK